MGVKSNKEEFIKKASVLNKNYNYSKVQYSGSQVKVCIVCPEHGDFWQRPDNHLNLRHKCPKCSRVIQERTNTSNIICKENEMIIPLNKGFYTIIDKEDYEKVSTITWRVESTKKHDLFYVVGDINGRVVKMHRIIMGIVDNLELEVDHIDHDGLNNTKNNLRLCTRKGNVWNRRASMTSSKYKGVSWHKRDLKWSAYITYNSVRISLGYHKTEEEGAKAYDEKAKELFGDFACLNFPNLT